MKDKERRTKQETCHIFIAIRRLKENKKEDMEWRGELCFRQIIQNEQDDLDQLLHKIKRHPGVWRIYKTVNPRSYDKARKMLMTELIERPEEWDYRIDTAWRTFLLKPECKAERNFLIDVDSHDGELLNKIETLIKSIGIVISEKIETPNGWHLVTDGPFDKRVLDCVEGVEVKPDAYVFVRRIEIGKDIQGA